MPIPSRTLPAFPLFLLVISTLLLSSCRAPHVELSTEHRDAIATVTVKDEIRMPEKALYSGPAASLGAVIGGVIGALVAESAEDADDLLTRVAETEEVNIEGIIREEIQRSFVESNPVGTVVEADGDAEFQFNVLGYGLRKYGWGFLDVGPRVFIESKLIKRDGTTAWEHTGHVGPLDDVPAKSFEEWLSDLDALREGFRQAVQIALAKSVEDLKKAK